MMEMKVDEHARFLDATVHTRIYVPDVYNVPPSVRRYPKKSDMDAIVTIGCAIEDATNHDQIVVQHATWKIFDFSHESNTQVTSGIFDLRRRNLKVKIASSTANTRLNRR
jgi:6,7-dimethyl-8-ribityllumazine synthase